MDSIILINNAEKGLQAEEARFSRSVRSIIVKNNDEVAIGDM